MADSDSVAQDQIRAFVDRILRMKEEAKAINADIREIYTEAKANGFDKTVLGKLVNYVERRAESSAALEESEALFDLYLAAYDGRSGTVVATHTYAHARESAAESTTPNTSVAWPHEANTASESTTHIDPETGEIQSAATRPQAPAADAGEGGDAPSSPAPQSVPAPPAQVAEAAPASGESAASREANMHVLPAANYLTPRGLIQLPSGLWRLPGWWGGDDCGSHQATKQRCHKCEDAWNAQQAAAE